jgi:hypothetical protein
MYYEIFFTNPKAMQETEKEYVQQVCLLMIRNMQLEKALLPLLKLADEVMSYEALSQERRAKTLEALEGVKKRLSIMEAAMEDLTEVLAHGNH